MFTAPEGSKAIKLFTTSSCVQTCFTPQFTAVAGNRVMEQGLGLASQSHLSLRGKMNFFFGLTYLSVPRKKLQVLQCPESKTSLFNNYGLYMLTWDSR